jgi:hypothetical protein
LCPWIRSYSKEWSATIWKGDRPDFSSERVPHRDNTENFRHKIISSDKSQSELDIKTYWLTVSRNMTFTIWKYRLIKESFESKVCEVHCSLLSAYCPKSRQLS